MPRKKKTEDQPAATFVAVNAEDLAAFVRAVERFEELLDYLDDTINPEPLDPPPPLPRPKAEIATSDQPRTSS